MSEPNLDDVMTETEQPRPDHREHATTPKHLDEDELDRRTEQEREQVAGED